MTSVVSSSRKGRRIFGLTFRRGTVSLSGFVTKDYILSEIRRHAQESGGQAPGRRRFESDTGIRETDWLGKFWSKWSDAVTEAGFSPNSMQRAFGTAEKFEPLIRFILEIGKFPTGPELKMKARSTPNFPSHSTFDKYGRRGLAEALLQYCKENQRPAEVISICEQVLIASTDEVAGASGGPQGEVDYGEVYLVKSGRHFKIGRSNHFGRRSYELALQLPVEAKLIHKILTDDPGGIEAYWHKRFEDKRTRGEWFDLSIEDVNAFKRRKFM